METTIDGTVYFISDDDSKIIYERVLEDDEYEIGDEIGYINNDGNVIWHSSKD